MRTVFVTHPADRLDTYFGANALRALEAVATVRLNPEPRELSTAELVAVAAGCDALIAYRQTPGPEALFTALPELAVFLRCAVDIRTIDVAAAGRHGVLVTQASPGFAAAVSEWIVGVMIALGRDIVRHAEAYHAGAPQVPAVGRELHGSTLGIVGFGTIGQRLAELALALGMHVRVTTLQPVEPRDTLRALPLDALLAESDFVVCLAPANADTANLMSGRAFAAMKRGSFFINAARGELVDDAALLAALDAGHLAGAAIDVGRAPDQMPTPELGRHPRVLATPHLGGLTRPATEHQALETVAQLTRLLAGELPPGAVNPERATRWRRWSGNP